MTYDEAVNLIEAGKTIELELLSSEDVRKMSLYIYHKDVEVFLKNVEYWRRNR